MAVVIVARVIQGAGGGMLPVAFGIIRDEFPAEKVPGAVGVLAAVGAGLGIVLGGPIVDLLDYHWLFWLPLILTLTATVSAVVFVPESPVRTPGRLTRQLGGKVLVITGCLIGAGSMAILAFAHQQQWEIYLSTALMGIGFGLAFLAMSALVVAAVPPSQTGVASGMNANIRTIGGSVGAAVMASIVTSQLGATGLPKESGYTIGLAVMAAGLVLAALAGLLIPSVRRLGHGDAGLEHGELAMVAGGTVAGDESD